MTNSRLRTFLAATTLSLTILACVLPGQNASQPAPTADTVLLETMVAETVSASITQTAGSPAEIPALTPSSPLLTETPVATPVPAMTGTIIEQIPDATTKYTDYDGGFELVFPAGWLVVRPNSDEFNVALANEGANNQGLHDQMTADQAGYDAEFDRLYSYPLRPDIEKNTIFGFSKLTWDSEDTTLLDNETMGELVRGLESSEALPGFLVDVSQMYENGNGVFMIEIGGRFTKSDGQGGVVPFYSTIIYFKPKPNSVGRLTATYLKDYKVQISADVKSVIESIKMIGQ